MGNSIKFLKIKAKIRPTKNQAHQGAKSTKAKRKTEETNLFIKMIIAFENIV